MRASTLLRTVVAAVTAVVMTAPAAAATTGADYPPSAPSLTLSASVVDPGGSLTISFSGFDPDTSVRIQVTRGLLDVDVTADEDGSGSVDVDIPITAAPGPAIVRATGVSDGSRLVLTAEFSVADDGTPPGRGDAAAEDDDLAVGGASTLALSVIGGVLLLLGLGAVAVGRRRSGERETSVLG